MNKNEQHREAFRQEERELTQQLGAEVEIACLRD